MSDIIKLKVTIENVRAENGRYLIKAGGQNYSFFEKKRDGTPTAAQQSWAELGLTKGSEVGLAYTVNGDFKNVAFFEKPEGIEYAPQNQPKSSPAPKDTETDWDAIARGKVRTHLVGAMLQAQYSDEQIRNRLPGLVDLVMNDPKETDLPPF